MDGMGIFLIGYCCAIVVIFLVGFIKIIIASIHGTSAKSGLWLVIIAVIMVVIGAGACALMLSGLNIR